MRIANHTKKLLCFWGASLSRKITLYFSVFGLLVFYLTSMAHLAIAKKHLINSLTTVISSQLSAVSNKDGDVWWRFVNNEQRELQFLAHTLIGLTSGTHKILHTSIYGQAKKNQPWVRLYLDDDDILRTAQLSKEEMYLFTEGTEDLTHSIAGLDLYIGQRTFPLFVNITSPNDQGRYFYNVVIDKQGVSCLLGDRYLNFIAISIAVFVLIRSVAYFFARNLAQPIEMLSSAATRVANGDLSFQLPYMGNTEIGTLGTNFNEMISALKEWRRIKQIEFEIEKGRKVQQDFLPKNIPQVANWDIAACFYPAREVSGDFYDVFDLPGGRLGLVIADVADKGVGSAFYMALIRSLVRVYAEQIFSRGNSKMETGDEKGNQQLKNIQAKELEVVLSTNSYLLQHHADDNMFATIFFGVLNPTTGRLVYVNGGHEPLYVVGRRGIKHELPPTGPAIGLMEDLEFSTGHLNLDPGDLLLGLTDGVTEACNANKELFTRTRLKGILSQSAASSRELLEKIRQQVFEFEGTAARSDDLTMLAVQRLL